MQPSDDPKFLALLERQKGAIYRVAYAYAQDGEDRRDLVQDIAIQLWRAWPTFDGRCAASTFAWRVAVNTAISFRRGERRRLRGGLPIDAAFDMAAADAAFGADGENMRALRALIDKLEPLSRALIVLFLEGSSHQDIADVLGLSATNVGTRLHRLKETLRRQFADAHREKDLP